MKPHLQKEFKCSDMLILMVGSVPCGVYLLVGMFNQPKKTLFILFL
jgi:hypothetical protein